MNRFLRTSLTLVLLVAPACGDTTPSAADSPRFEVVVAVSSGSPFAAPEPFVPTVGRPVVGARVLVRFRDGSEAEARTDKSGQASVVGAANTVTTVVVVEEGYSVDVITDLTTDHPGFHFPQSFIEHPDGSLVVWMVPLHNANGSHQIRVNGTLLNKPADDDFVFMSTTNGTYSFYQQSGNGYEISASANEPLKLIGSTLPSSSTWSNQKSRYWFRVDLPPTSADTTHDIDLDSVTKLHVNRFTATLTRSDDQPFGLSDVILSAVASKGGLLGWQTAVEKSPDGKEASMSGEYADFDDQPPLCLGFKLLAPLGVSDSFLLVEPAAIEAPLAFLREPLIDARADQRLRLPDGIPIRQATLPSGTRGQLLLTQAGGVTSDYSPPIIYLRWDFLVWKDSLVLPLLPSWALDAIPPESYAVVRAYTTSIHDGIPYMRRHTVSNPVLVDRN